MTESEKRAAYTFLTTEQSFHPSFNMDGFGTLNWNGSQYEFEGDPHESAKVFADYLLRHINRPDQSLIASMTEAADKALDEIVTKHTTGNVPEINRLQNIVREALSGHTSDPEVKYWVLLQEPKRVPERKGPFNDEWCGRFIREAIDARPSAYITVLEPDGAGGIWPEEGGNWLIQRDLRSRPKARRHWQDTALAHGPHTTLSDEAWPPKPWHCAHKNSCMRNRQCMYAGCVHSALASAKGAKT